MEETSPAELSSFFSSGIYRLEGRSAVFVDPVRVLDGFYTRFKVSRSAYYSRSFEPANRVGSIEENGDISSASTKRKRKRKNKPLPYKLNEREKAAEQRHQEARPFLVKAHEALLGAVELLSILPDLMKGEDRRGDDKAQEMDFIELGRIWQAPFYEMSLCFVATKEEGSYLRRHGTRNKVLVFNNLISNETSGDIEAEFLDSLYILPRRSCFHMSDLRQTHNLIPAQSCYGYNLIVIDPPWENGSVYQKTVYPTLPNRHFLYLPIKQLAHTEGALVVLWMTNKEKLRRFVEEELFPAWEVVNITPLYWLKVKPDGSLIGDLDLFHHKPYEYLLLGYFNGKPVDSEWSPTFTCMQSNQVLISIPGAHSRKPPLEKILSDYIPGPKPARCIELFARELVAGWTSWGNEPLHFQDSRYFVEKAGAT